MKQILLVSILLLSACASKNNDKELIRNILSQQANAWNKGNIDNYMQLGYWQNDSLLFIGSRGPTYGYNATLSNYKKSYPTSEKMGTLTFSQLQLKRISTDHYFVIGRWALDRANGNLSGYFTLLFKKIDGEWKIIADHSS